MTNKHFQLFIASMFLVCTTKAQVKTKTYFGDIPEKIIPMKQLVVKEYKILPTSEFNNLKLLSENNDDSEGKTKFALPTIVNIDILKEALLTKSDNVGNYN